MRFYSLHFSYILPATFAWKKNGKLSQERRKIYIFNYLISHVLFVIMVNQKLLYFEIFTSIFMKYLSFNCQIYYSVNRTENSANKNLI